MIPTLYPDARLFKLLRLHALILRFTEFNSHRISNQNLRLSSISDICSQSLQLQVVNGISPFYRPFVYGESSGCAEFDKAVIDFDSLVIS